MPGMSFYYDQNRRLPSAKERIFFELPTMKLFNLVINWFLIFAGTAADAPRPIRLDTLH